MSLALRPKPVDFEEVWGGLGSTVQKILTLKHLDKKVWDDNFHDIYSLCVAVPEPLSDQLYTRTKECLEHHVDALYQSVVDVEESELLGRYWEQWRVYYQGTKFLHSLYGYLNKQHIKRHKYSDADLNYGGLTVDQLHQAMLEIGELALDIWCQKMIWPLREGLVTQLMAAMAADRAAEGASASSVVHGVIQSLVDVYEYRARHQLQLYETLFETPFLAATSDYYRNEAGRLLEEFDCSQYMQKVIGLIEEEQTRARKLVHASSHEKLTNLLQQVMVAAHQHRLHARSNHLVRLDMRPDLQNMYKLLKPIPQGLNVLIREFQNHAQSIGLEGVQNLHASRGEAVPQQFVDNILGVYNKFSEIVREVFNNDQEFFGAMDKALLTAVNHKEESRSCPKASEWLARYTDILLRKSAKGLTESDVEDKLSKAVIIFRYIDDKDVFQKFYSKMLAQRLIPGVSVSMDAEESMINKLKQACGYEFTSKLQRMFTDIGISKDLTEKFLSSQLCADMNVHMQIQVLQAGAWPLSAATTAVAPEVPAELQRSIGLFEEFYARQYNGRRLTWLHNFATVDVRLTYLEKAYQVTMSVQQLVLLLAFQTRTGWTVGELGADTQLPTDHLHRLLRTLLDPAILTSDAEKDQLTDYSMITLNEQFTSKRIRFRVNTAIFQRQAEKETEQVNTTVQQDRKYFLECTIVRIMKTRKISKHNSLINEVIDQSKARFTPDIAFIKKVLESLIEKQYLQRTDNNDEYAYLA